MYTNIHYLEANSSALWIYEDCASYGLHGNKNKTS